MNPVAKTLAVVGLALALCVLLWLTTVILGRKAELTDREVTEVRMSFLADECDKYKRAYGSWPTQISQIGSLLPPDRQEICFDAWGREFHLLAYTNDPSTIWLESYGPDGVKGGTGSNAPSIMKLH